jgi:nitrate reductase beta subunit
VRDVLARLAAMRSFMRDVNLGRDTRPEVAEAVGMTPEEIQDMYRLLAIAKYDERYVIPPAHAEHPDMYDEAHRLEEMACSLDYDGGPGMGGSGPFGESSGGPAPIAVENFEALRQRQTSDTLVDPSDASRRVNLLNWDGKGSAGDLMPPRSSSDPGDEPSGEEGR